MTHILTIHSSANGETSLSRKLAGDILHKLQSLHGTVNVTERDLNAHPVPHLSGETVASLFGGAPSAGGDLSNTLIDEILAADILIIDAPMYNFSIPSNLKAWIDHVIRAGRTFNFLPGGGFEALVPAGKKVYIATARGGVYSDASMKAYDLFEPLLRTALGFIGLTDVEVIVAEGTSRSDIGAEKALANAHAQFEATLTKKAA